jgi:phosphatidylglycerophosphate synthase
MKYSKVVNEKIFTKIAQKNILIYWLSIIAYPFSVILSKIKVTPNQITTCSLIFCTISFYFLIIHSLKYFCFFYIISSILDLCDGQVARIKNNITKSKLNFDHLSDIFKISLILLGIGIFYNLIIIWIVVFITNSLFLFLMVLHELNNCNKTKIVIKKIRECVSSINFLFKVKFLSRIFNLWFNAFFTISLITTLLFAIIPFNYYLALLVFIYINFILLFNILKYLRKIYLTKIN